MPAVHWFRRDLRLDDLPSLAAAAAHGPVWAVFVSDPRLDGLGEARRQALGGHLAALDAQTGGRLTVLRGRPEQVLPGLAREVGAREVFVTGEVTPFGRRRDGLVAKALSDAGCRLLPVSTPYAVAPGVLRTASGGGFRVFTPFHRAWQAATERAQPMPEVVFAPSKGVGLTLPDPAPDPLRAWSRFLSDGVGRYPDLRDRPDLQGTSRMSTSLHFGAIHPRSMLADLGDSPGEVAFARQLAWREFCADVLWHRPDAAWRSLDERFDEDMEYARGAQAEQWFSLWSQGRTGYPFVDAGMRQLLTEGWMHNRLRMVTASFLVKDLHLPWQRGAAWFAQQLTDADVANNQLGWQWVAGCGTDAAPYFRIFNPVTQGRRFDPQGDFVRRFVPELRHLDGPEVHEPGVLRGDYPQPIIEHAVERDTSLARFRGLPPRSGAR